MNTFSLSLSQESRRGVPEVASLFLAEMAHANRSPHTCRAYRAELARFAGYFAEPTHTINTNILRGFLLTRQQTSPASRARTQAALASFLSWACQQGLIGSNPMDLIERVRLDEPRSRALPSEQVAKILRVIESKRDQLLFGLIAACGLRAGEALGLHVEDINLTRDDEHFTVLGKGGRRRTVLLDDAGLVTALKAHLKRTGYSHGPVFRAERNGRGGPLRYQTAQARWAAYCRQTAISCTLHQLRHSHATELVNGGVSLATIRKRLGHRNLQTTLRYAELSDTAADAEIRAWRRSHHRLQ